MKTRNTLKTGRGLGLTLVIFLACSGVILAESPSTPSVVFPEKSYEFPAVLEGTQVTHDFPIENRGSAPLEIKGVHPD